jgi:predicted transcriptional regulator
MAKTNKEKYNCLLNYTYSNLQNDIEKAREYTEQANQLSNQYRDLLLNIFESTDTKYQIMEDGTFRYWYTP